MVVLRAIGRFFCKIGRWIKETAWVQPLLIVGGVFAIIFSISPITNWVQSWFSNGNPAAAFYGSNAYKKSLSGARNGTSEADKLFEYILGGWTTATEAEKTKYGTKFWVAIVENNCSACDATYKGFETLASNWNRGQYKIDDNKPFKLHTIFADSTEEVNGKTENLFTDYFWNAHSEFFEESATATEDSPYYKYKVGTEGKSSSYYKSLENLGGNATDNSTPMFFLVDLDAEVPWINNYYVSCVMFTFTNDDKCGSTSFDKAAYLADCWNYKGVFGVNE